MNEESEVNVESMIICKSVITDIISQLMLKDSTSSKIIMKTNHVQKTFRHKQRMIETFFKPAGDTKKRKMSDEIEQRNICGQDPSCNNGKKRKRNLINKVKILVVGDDSRENEASRNVEEATTSAPNMFKEATKEKVVVESFADESPILPSQALNRERVSDREPGYWRARAEKDKKRSRSLSVATDMDSKDQHSSKDKKSRSKKSLKSIEVADEHAKGDDDECSKPESIDRDFERFRGHRR